MPLSRIWNAFFGRPATPDASRTPPSARPTGSDSERTAAPLPPGAGATPGPVVNQETGAAARRREAASPDGASGRPVFPPPSPTAKRPNYRIDRQLRKLTRDLSVSKVLEIFLADGERTCAALQTVAGERPLAEIDYTAIDPFRDRPGESLRIFHQTVRNRHAQVRVLPGTMAEGLQRVARTVGTVDLVLIGAPETQWADPACLLRLDRVCHERTRVLVHDGQRWHRYERGTDRVSRKAA